MLYPRRSLAMLRIDPDAIRGRGKLDRIVAEPINEHLSTIGRDAVLLRQRSRFVDSGTHLVIRRVPLRLIVRHAGSRARGATWYAPCRADVAFALSMVEHPQVNGRLSGSDDDDDGERSGERACKRLRLNGLSAVVETVFQCQIMIV